MVRVPSLNENAPAECKNCYASICLPSQNIFMGEQCHISGWGQSIHKPWWWDYEIQYSSDKKPKTLKEEGVLIMSNQYCAKCTRKFDLYKDYTTVTGLEFCAGTLDRNGDGYMEDDYENDYNGNDYFENGNNRNGFFDDYDEAYSKCAGDQGAPLTCVRNGQPELVGVTSRAWCNINGGPTVFVNIAKYISWIELVAGWTNSSKNWLTG